MTKLCFMCLGCVRLEDKAFEGVYKCENFVRSDKGIHGDNNK